MSFRQHIQVNKIRTCDVELVKYLALKFVKSNKVVKPKMKTHFLLCILASSFSLSAFAQKDYVYSERNRAIQGYDPVAYFVDSKPTKGKKNITYRWKDANWHFANEENREAYISNPNAYAPQFGGYCAYALSEGYLYKIDPNAWKIVDGKLYLNYDLNTQKLWEAKQDERIKKAESLWPGILSKE